MTLITVHASPPRRAVAVVVVGALAVLLLSLGLRAGDTPLIALAFLACGAAGGWAAWALWRATAERVIWTGDALRTGADEVIATADQIARVDRGAFAFKPSSGFVLTLTARAPRRWAPGLWWRFGRRVGVGGVTHAAPAKAMAEAIALTIAARDTAD